MQHQQFDRVDMIVQIEDRLTLWQNIIYGLQQLTVDGTALVIPVLLGLALKLQPAQIGTLVQGSLLGAGLVTVAQSLWVLKLPVLQGPGIVFISIMASTAATVGLAQAWTAMIIGGLLTAVLAWPLGVWGKIRHVLAAPPVYGTYLTLLALAIAKTIFDQIIGTPNTPFFGSGQNFLLAAVPFLVAIVLVLFSPRSYLRFASLLVAAVVGALLSIAMGRYNYAAVASAGWFSLPRPLSFGFAWNTQAVILLFIGYFANAAEVLGGYRLIGEVMGRQTVSERRMNFGLLSEGLGSAVGAVFGGLGTITYTQNAGAISLTGIGSRFVFSSAGVIMLILGLVPKVGQVVVALPPPVLAGLLLATVAMLSMQGVRVLGSMPLTNVNMLAAGSGLVVGIGLTYAPAEFAARLPAFARPFLANGLIMGFAVVLILYAVFGAWLNLGRLESGAAGQNAAS